MPKSTTKRPFHETIIDELGATLNGRGQWREIAAQPLVRVLGRSIVPPQAIPSILKRLKQIQAANKRDIGLAPVIKSLERDRQEHIR